MFGKLAPPDQAVLARPGMPEAFQRLVVQSMAQGTKGAALDFALEARPWGLHLPAVRAAVDVWHGEADTVVSPEQGRILAGALPSAQLHLLPGEAHLSLRFDHAGEVLERLV
jgi:pimeloyl-ACP methyl ester carboxylesterase